MYALEIKGLCKSYKGFTLDHLDLTLPMGCILGLVGENGAGKTTTIKLILDMLRRDSGTITILGRDNQKNLRLNKEDIGVVPDEIGISECLNARQVGRIMALTFRNWDNAKYDDYLKRLSIPDNKRFKEFSRGMKMKLGIAVALSHNPKLLILDEATSGLDPIVRDSVTDIFSEFTRDENHAVLISSHIVSDLEKICDYIAFLHKGKLLLFEEKDRLKEQFCIVHGTAQDLADISPAAIKGKKMTPYGVDAIVAREFVPNGMPTSPIDIEQLFIFRQ